MKVVETVGAARTAPCRVVCAASLSLMYSSMHSPGRGVNRLERTLLNFFSWMCVRSGYFGVLEGCFVGDFGGSGEARMGGFAAKFRGFLGWARVQRGYSAHGGHCRASLVKIFLKKGRKTEKLGCERCRKVARGYLI